MKLIQDIGPAHVSEVFHRVLASAANARRAVDADADEAHEDRKESDYRDDEMIVSPHVPYPRVGGKCAADGWGNASAALVCLAECVTRGSVGKIANSGTPEGRNPTRMTRR